MERLTCRRNDDGFINANVLLRWKRFGPAFFPDKQDYQDYSDALERLAQYEDTGVDPEEIKRIQETLVTAQRLKKEQYDTLENYLKAEADGRLVILPCKAGSEVFVLWLGSVVPATVIGFHFYEWREGYSVRVLFDTRKISGTRDFSFEAFGKTLFFTREEAEAALKGETNG